MIGLWHYRRWIWEAALADLRHRYAGSGLGVFWNVLTPLAMLAIYTFVFSNVLVVRFPDAPVSAALFPIYLSAGFLPWGAFADCVTRGASSLVINAVHLKKMPIPEQVFVAQAAVSSTLSMFIVLALLFGLALAFAQPPLWTWLLLPIIAVLWQGFGFGLALALATLNTFFRDVAQILGVLLQIWMWSVPVVYFEELLPEAYRASLPLNPAYPFVTALRDAYMFTAPAAWVWAAMLGWAAVATVLGFILLQRMRPEIRDVL